MFGQTTVTQTTFTATSADNLNGDKKVSYSCEKGGGTVAPAVNSGEIRLYQISSGKNGGTITIKIADGNKINSISIGSSMGTSVAYTIDSETTLSKSASLAANREYSLTGLQATSVTFYCMGTTSKTRLYVNKLSVTYSATGAGKTQPQLTFPKDSYSFSTTDDLSSFTGQTPTLKAGESELTGKTITYSKTGDDIFTSFEESTGNLALNGKAGTATVTAKFAGDATYAASTASYTITVQDNRAVPTLTFDKESYSFDLGATVDPFTNQLKAPEGVTVVYSSNSDIATVNETTGEVTVNTAAVGKATITATFAGNDSYKPATVSYTIEVKKPMLPPTFDFTQSENNYSSGATPGENYIETSTWTSGKVKMVTSKGNSQGFRWWKKTDGTVLRSYDGCSLTISVNKGLLINSIEFEGVISGFTADKGTLKSGKWTGSAQTVTFSFSDKRDIKSITVTYEKDAAFTLESLTTAASGFATYAADYDVNYSALGLTAYTIALDEANNKVSYNRFVGVVPANKAVLVQGEASKKYELTPAEEAADATFTTDLKASDGTVTAADDKVYAFGTLNGKSGFKLVTDGIKIPAKKGYLELTGATAAKPTFFAFDGIGTGISHIEADAALENAAMYNLAGQRVDKSYKGVVIVNGKKMLRK